MVAGGRVSWRAASLAGFQTTLSSLPGLFLFTGTGFRNSLCQVTRANHNLPQAFRSFYSEAESQAAIKEEPEPEPEKKTALVPPKAASFISKPKRMHAMLSCVAYVSSLT